MIHSKTLLSLVATTLVLIAIFATAKLISTKLNLRIGATTNTASSIEAENATRQGNVTQGTDSTASNGRYIEFTGSTVPTSAPISTPLPSPTLPPIVSSAKYISTTGNNSNSGTITQPWRSLSYAAEQLNPGQTLYIRGGTYNEQVRLSAVGTASQRITITNYPGETVTFMGNNFQIGSYGSTTRAQYLNVSGFTITNSSSSGLNHSGSHNKIERLTIKNSQDGGVSVSFTQDSDFNFLHVHDNVLSNRNSGASGGWPTAVGVFDSSNVRFRNNTIHNNWGEGLDAWRGADHITFANNTVYDNWSENIYLDHGSFSLVENNLIYETETSDPNNKNLANGISLADEPRTDLAGCNLRDNIIRNNIIIGTRIGINNFEYSNRACSGLKNTKIENNTIINQWDQGIRILGSQSSNSYIRNNIIYPRSGVEIEFQSPRDTQIQNNLVNQDPLLVNRNSCTASSCPASNFKLTSSSPARNAGFGAITIQTDYFGLPRILPYDIGAHEF